MAASAGDLAAPIRLRWYRREDAAGRVAERGAGAGGTGHLSAVRRDGGMQHGHGRGNHMVVGEAARDRTARRLLEVRLRLEIARREAAQPADPRIGQARQELHTLTRAATVLAKRGR